jgi:hypothetical protein
MDKVIVRRKKALVIEKCGVCIYGKSKNLQAKDVPNGWVYCVLWNGQKPFNGWCSEFKS